MVRCKFICQEVAKTLHGGHRVALGVVSSGSEENKEFFKYTPAGSLSFQSINDAAVAHFEPGKEYYIDISPAGE